MLEALFWITVGLVVGWNVRPGPGPPGQVG